MNLGHICKISLPLAGFIALTLGCNKKEDNTLNYTNAINTYYRLPVSGPRRSNSPFRSTLTLAKLLATTLSSIKVFSPAPPTRRKSC